MKSCGYMFNISIPLQGDRMKHLESCTVVRSQSFLSIKCSLVAGGKLAGGSRGRHVGQFQVNQV